ncbi:MAG: glycosyl transferase [Chloroflexi bacterium]|nr:MAG: glycosyl transferase [Chloroflexota bacterium]MBL1194165.1 glycosyl transferase [Chloroflexota bacterium]NOH11457.1 glycosyl transferase [Chloroflexota bacterium]
MRYGHFDDERREYLITRPDTPLPWINYLGTEDYFGLISNTAGGYSFYKDARLRRLTRYRYNHAPLDMGGRYIYLRDDAPSLSEPQVWSPSWMPVQRKLDSYECRHGMGYTTIQTQLADIESQTRYFVPLDESLEIWELNLTNHRSEAADLSIFSAVEFCLWDALDDATNFQRNYSIGEIEVWADLDSSPWPLPHQGGGASPGEVIIHKSEYRERRNHFAYFTCSEKLAGYDTDREAFLGLSHGWDAPVGVEAGQLSNSIGLGWQPIGAQHIKVHLEAGEQKKIIFLLGYHENPKDDKFDPPDSQNVNRKTVLPIISKYLDPNEVQKAFEDLREYWDELLGKFTVNTPDVHTNRMVNVWNAYQNMITFNLSRSASYFESGIGRGMGFRDSNQDLLGFVHLIPERARERILDLAATQLPTGGAYHQYQPLTKRGNNDIGSNFNDDPLWLVLSVVAYVKETGDWNMLNEPVPYDNQPGSEAPLYDHVQRSIKYTMDRLGPNGLPLIGRADWNDCLNLNAFSDSPGQSFQTTTNRDGKVAESVFIAGLFVLAVGELIELTKKWNADLSTADFPLSLQDMQNAKDSIESAVLGAGWDGDWFRRAYDNFGHVLGSKENDEGRIFIEPQGLCIMSGMGLEDGRAQKALDSVAEHLATPHGIVLHQPAFTKYYLHLGEISSYPPGYKENAGVFCHTNPWIMIAETKIGRGDNAFDYYQRINPSAREEISEVHRSEPYVYAQMIAGKDAPKHGEAKNSWLTGTAAWNYVAITQWVLGIRPTYDGLQIAPVVPADWDSFEAERSYRGVRYLIHVERTGPGNEVVLEFDGKPLEGNIVPIPTNGKTEVQVKAKLGKK